MAMTQEELMELSTEFAEESKGIENLVSANGTLTRAVILSVGASIVAAIDRLGDRLEKK